MLSVFITLSEAVRLGLKQCGLIAALVAVDMAAFALRWMPDVRHSVDLLHQLLTTTETIVLLVFDLLVIAIKPAAILGALARPNPPWRSAFQSIRSNTWTLVRVGILIVLVAALFLLPAAAIAKLFATLGVTTAPGTKLVLLVGTIIYLVFVKYALADPIVVLEGLDARAALEKSWRMTKTQFWYVLACILVLSVIHFFIHGVFAHFGSLEAKDFLGISYDAASAIIECLSILVAWCMYWHLRDAENAEMTLNVSPPAPPSGPQSA